MNVRVSFLLVFFFFSVTGFAQQHDHEAGVALEGPFFPCVLTTDGSEISPDALYNLVSAGETSAIVGSSNGTATFDVSYTGFTPQAQAAFQHAVDLWATRIESDVTIQVDAEFGDLGNPQILGGAGPASFWINFPGSEPNVIYGAALADALFGSDIEPDSSDINAVFNSNPITDWYFGTDGNPPPGESDFVSVVLHELGHGLGFVGSADFDESTGEGSWGFGTGFPLVYDLPVEDFDGTSILDTGTYPNPSTDLGALLRSDSLYVDSPGVITATGGPRGKLYAPATWSSGSSYSHWDEATYNGTPNALMTFAIASGEAIHDPGPMTCGFFEDMGWVRGPDCPLTIAVEASPEELADVLSVPRPNPAHGGVSTFTVAVEQPQRVSVDLFDTMGRRVQALYDGVLAAGMGERLFLDASTLPGGVYVIRAMGEDFAKSRRVTVVR